MNTYTMHQMVECLNLQPNIEFVEVTLDCFEDYGSILDRFYKPSDLVLYNNIISLW